MAKLKTRPEAREVLLDAASARFMRQGYAATSLDDVCTDSGLTKGALFHYFASKESLGLAALERWIARGEHAFATGAYLDAAEPLDRALGLVDFASELARMGPPGCLAGIFTQEFAATNEGVRQSCAASFGRWVDHFETLIRSAKEAHAPGSDIDPRGLAQHALAVIQGSIILARAHNRGAIIEEQLRHFRTYLAMRFAAAQKPRLRAARRRASRGPRAR